MDPPREALRSSRLLPSRTAAKAGKAGPPGQVSMLEHVKIQFGEGFLVKSLHG